MALLDELKARDVHQTGHWELKSGRHAETYLQCTIAMGDPAFARRIGRQLADELRDLDANVVCAPGVSSMILGFVVAIDEKMRISGVQSDQLLEKIVIACADFGFVAVR